MSNIIELTWPGLGEAINKQIQEHYLLHRNVSKRLSASRQSKDISTAQFTTQTPGYYHLTNWPEQIDFLTEILSGHKINNKFLNHLTIQHSIGNLAAHTDTFRTMSVIYVVAGPADTVFYRLKDGAGILPAKVFDKSQLVETERYRLEINKWYLFNNSAIHAVENSSSPRTSLTFNLTNIGVFSDFRDAVQNIHNSGVLFL